MSEAERRALRALVATLLGNPISFIATDLPVDLVRRHMLAPLAHRAGVAAFRNDFIASSLQAERRAAELRSALDALGTAGIPVILLKGIAYAGSIYSDPGERPMSDIDLLVRDSDIAPAERALGRLGYWRAGSAAQATVTRHAITLKRREGSIDLHRHILHVGRSRIDLDAIWRDARPSHVDGGLRPAPLHEYLLHVAHIGRHEGNVPLINYVDTHRLRSSVEPAAAHTLAAAWSVARATRAAEISVDELRAGRAPSAGPHVNFPSTDELLVYTLPARWLQIIRKLRMIDDWRGFAGLAAATVRARIAPLRRHSS